ncbi:uncharacterized protein RJT20DRAFT_45631 [Scheffersomyces xylosifermentans]|uniref:uncharacterized protein n=1 Tax=Scheffersomyces xylosifermentans TaxID=1304137 RepID=UPI00315DC98F
MAKSSESASGENSDIESKAGDNSSTGCDWHSRHGCHRNRDSATTNANIEEYERMIAQFQDLKQSVSEFTRGFFNRTNDSLSDFNVFAKDYSLGWLFDLDKESTEQLKEARKTFKSLFNDDNSIKEVEESTDIDAIYPRPYEVRDVNRGWGRRREGPFDGVFNGMGDFYGGRFSDRFGGSIRSGKTPFGYYSFRTPSTRYYHNCLNKGGESVWDARGYWRCLFPNREVPVELLNYKQEKLRGQILTKEDLDNAIQEKGIDESSIKGGTIDLGEKGVYFRKFDDYLNWKNIMYSNIRKERENSRNRYLDNINSARKEVLPVVEATSPNSNAPVGDDSKKVVSRSLSSVYTSNTETNEVEFKETKTEFFDDGTSVTKTIRKSKPFDAKDWADVSENVSQEQVTTSRGDSGFKGGWFWNSGKKE